MPLVNLAATTKIEIGDDWYELKNQLGFYDETVMLVDAVDPDELRSFKLIDDSNGVVKSKQTPGEMVARRNFIKLQAYIIAWSHTEEPKKLVEKLKHLIDVRINVSENSEEKELENLDDEILQLGVEIKEKEISTPITSENIQRIPREDAKILLEKIEELEGSIPQPFRESSENS